MTDDRSLVLHNSSLTWVERYHAALRYAAGRAAAALLTGTAALALHGFRTAPPPEAVTVLDLLVPPRRRLPSVPGVRLHRTRRMPPPVRFADGLRAAPSLRAVADTVRLSGDLRWTRTVLHEATGPRGLTPAALSAELHRNGPPAPAVRAMLIALGAPAPPSPAEFIGRGPIAAADLPQPLWTPRLSLDGCWLANPDAYWPRHGVLLELGTAPRRPAGRTAGEQAMARHNSLETMGFCLLHFSPRQVRREPELIAGVIRKALATGPHGPVARVTTGPPG